MLFHRTVPFSGRYQHHLVSQPFSDDAGVGVGRCSISLSGFGRISCGRFGPFCFFLVDDIHRCSIVAPGHVTDTNGTSDRTSARHIQPHVTHGPSGAAITLIVEPRWTERPLHGIIPVLFELGAAFCPGYPLTRAWSCNSRPFLFPTAYRPQSRLDRKPETTRTAAVSSPSAH